MTEQAEPKRSAESVRERIKAAFPDSIFSGPITGIDGEQQLYDERDDEGNPIYDEEQALYETLRGKRWSEIPGAFIEIYSDCHLLLSDAAFAAYLPAWLSYSLTHEEVRELMVYAFSPESHESMEGADHRLRRLTPLQIEALREFLAYALDVTTSTFVKKEAFSAMAYITSIADLKSKQELGG